MYIILFCYKITEIQRKISKLKILYKERVQSSGNLQNEEIKLRERLIKSNIYFCQHIKNT